MKYLLATDTSEASEIAQLHASSWRFAYREVLSAGYLNGNVVHERQEHWAKKIEHPVDGQRIILAKKDDVLIGFACIYLDQDEEYGSSLDNLHVCQSHQGRGFGKGLIVEIAKLCQAQADSKHLYLWVLESNINARRFYEHLGAKNSGKDVWVSPDRRVIPKLRYAWSNLNALVRG